MSESKPKGETVARKARITVTSPVLLVKDVVASAEYYRDKVGFTITGLYYDPPTFAILERDQSCLFLSETKVPGAITPNWKVNRNIWNIYYYVDDVEAMYQEMIARGAIIDYELCLQPWGTKEFGIQDLDDYDIAFSQILPDPALHE